MSNYQQMWSDLGLDLKAHDALLAILGGIHLHTLLFQKSRLEGTKYFDHKKEPWERGML